jgi:L-lactate permease
MSRDDESRLFRFTFKHSVLPLVAIGILSMLYAHVFPGLVPAMPPQ